MNAQQRANLEILVEFLKTSIPKARFDFSKWVGPEWKGKPDLSCGTTACALGWATTIPELRAQGLKLFKDEQGAKFPVMEKYLNKVPHMDPLDLAILSCQVLFGIDTSTAARFFIPVDSRVKGSVLPESATAADVAELIREYLDTNPDTNP